MSSTTPILVCEGSSDKVFFTELLRVRSLPAFDIRHPNGKQTGTGHGKGAIGAYVKSLDADSSVGHRPGVLIIVDRDDGQPKSNFDLIAEHLAAAGIAAPESVGATADDERFGSVRIVLIPGADEPGQLETLCLRALEENHGGAVACARALLSCEHVVDSGNDNHREKMLLAFSLACACGKVTNLEHAWERNPQPISVNSTHFDEIAEELRQFAATD